MNISEDMTTCYVVGQHNSTDPPLRDVIAVAQKLCQIDVTREPGTPGALTEVRLL